MTRLNDLKSNPRKSHHPAGIRKEGRWYELGEYDLFSTRWFPFTLAVPEVREPLRRRAQSEIIFMLGSIPVHGFCPIDLPGRSPGYRGMSARCQRQALPYGNTEQGIAQYALQCQHGSGLAHLRRLGQGLVAGARTRY